MEAGILLTSTSLFVIIQLPGLENFFGNDIPVYTTFHLNQTFYTLSRPEPSLSLPERPFVTLNHPFVILNHPFVILNDLFVILNHPSVILNEVKDLHTQFGVYCPVEKESKNARTMM